MTEYELHDQDYIYRLELNGICKYDKQTKECLRNIPYETISTVELTYIISRYRYRFELKTKYYKCTIYSNKNNISFSSQDDYGEHYTNLVKELHNILMDKKIVVHYKIGNWTTVILSILEILFMGFVLFGGYILASLSAYIMLFSGMALIFLLHRGNNGLVSFPRRYAPTNIPASLLPLELAKKYPIVGNYWKYQNLITIYTFAAPLFIILVATFAFVFFLFGEGIYTNILHRNETKRSLYNNTNSNIAAIYIENSENILEQNEILKPHQHIKVWLAVDTLKKKGENSTVKLLFTDSISYEFRMPLDSRYNGCNYDICINDDGNH